MNSLEEAALVLSEARGWSFRRSGLRCEARGRGGLGWPRQSTLEIDSLVQIAGKNSLIS